MRGVSSIRFFGWLAAGVALLAAVATHWGLVQRLDHLFLDAALKNQARARAPDPAIVLLDIDEATLNALSDEYGRYPWSRAVFGELLQGLARQKPKAIVFDILFTDPHRDHASDDTFFVSVARALPNVYFPFAQLSPGHDPNGYPLNQLKAAVATAAAKPDAKAALLLPLAGLAQSPRLGTVNAFPDTDGVVRRYPLYRQIDGWRLPSLPARVARDFGASVPEQEDLILRWHGPARTTATLSFHEVFFDLSRQKPKRPANEFTDKIIVIGASASGLHDLKVTPVDTRMPGPEIVATAIDNLKNGESISIASPWLGFSIALLGLLALVFSLARGVSLIPVGVALALAGLTLLAAAWALIAQRQWVVPVGVALTAPFGFYAIAALRVYLDERKKGARIAQLFSRFLDPRVVRELIERGDSVAAIESKRLTITVLFSDIRDFTSLSEKMGPNKLVELLNHYFARQVKTIFHHGGTLDKYIGDAVMAFWGAPGEETDHAARALACAREMEQNLFRFKEEIKNSGPNLDIGIGLHTGVAVVGFIGSPEHRQDYTVIGDTVNTASRIEAETRGRARILVSQATRDAALDAVPRFVDHGRVKLKGKSEKVRLYEPKWD